MRWLKWITNEDLENEVDRLLQIALSAKTKSHKNFGENVIDPFSALFEISGFDVDFETWYKGESNRQAQKTLQNHIGTFHQNILGYSIGWENMKTGSVIDLKSDGAKIVAEIKNKYNTISGGKLSDLYYSLVDLVNPKSSIYKGYTAYYVKIIPKKPYRYDKLFTPSDKGSGSKCPNNENIRETDGASFYSLVTGEADALKDLFNVLPDVIKKISKRKINTFELKKLEGFFLKAYG